MCDKNDIVKMTEEGLKCFWNVFFLVNKTENMIKK